MNWLAHVLLSERYIEHRLGNLLADVVRGEERRRMTLEFQRGAQRHHAIDAFTDAHPLVRRSRARLSATHRRFSGVLVDVFYDHLLAVHWERYCAQPLQRFASEFYEEARAARLTLPDEAQLVLGRIIEYDILSSYARVDAVEQSLRRLSARLATRWRRPFRLEDSVEELRAQHAEFAADFEAFFPQLQAHISRGDVSHERNV